MLCTDSASSCCCYRSITLPVIHSLCRACVPKKEHRAQKYTECGLARYDTVWYDDVIDLDRSISRRRQKCKDRAEKKAEESRENALVDREEGESEQKCFIRRRKKGRGT